MADGYVTVTKVSILNGDTAHPYDTDTESGLEPGGYWTPSAPTHRMPEPTDPSGQPFAHGCRLSIQYNGQDYTTGTLICPPNDFTVYYYFDALVQITQAMKLDDVDYGGYTYAYAVPGDLYTPVAHPPEGYPQGDNVGLLRIEQDGVAVSGTVTIPAYDVLFVYWYNHKVTAKRQVFLNGQQQEGDYDVHDLWTNGLYTPKEHLPENVDPSWKLIEILYNGISYLTGTITIPNHDFYIAYKYTDQYGSAWIYVNGAWKRATPWIYCTIPGDNVPKWRRAVAHIYDNGKWKRGINP